MAAESSSAQTDAVDAGLRWVSDAEPGISRRRAGAGFSYRLPDGAPLRDRDVIARIRALAIPPAYTEVWICRNARGHLQATGRDARRRKQYRYHPNWRQVRDEGKFGRLVEFGRALPQLRRRLGADLKLPGWPRDRVLALVVSLMAETLVRVGNDEYARTNKSFGLTTLRNRHVVFSPGSARLRFRGKSGKEHDLQIDDARLAKLVRGCQGLPGQALFQYRADDGSVVPVDSADVNDYLRTAMGGEFTAKDFRTWGGTLLAFRKFAATPLPLPGSDGAISAAALAATEKGVVAEVAATLGNTIAVCRKAYIDPQVFAAWEAGELSAGTARGLRQWELSALRFLERGRKGTRKPATRRS